MKSKAYNYLYVCLENLPQWDTFYIYICYLQIVDMYQNIRTPPDQTPTTPYQLYIYICYLQIVDSFLATIFSLHGYQTGILLIMV